MRTHWYPLTVVLILIGSVCCLAQPTASTDRVPAGDWTYDALMHLAAEGLVPVPAQRFMGDWLYTRKEMSNFVFAAVQRLDESASEGERAILARLVAEFSPELQYFGASFVMDQLDPFVERNAVIPTAAFQPRIVQSDGETHLIGIYDATGFVTRGKYLTIGATLSNVRRQFGSDEFSRLDKYFIRGKTPNWEWEIGQNWMWWGPGYSGSMILSDNSPAFPMVKLGKDFNFGRKIGNIKITQFVSRFEDDGQTFYLLGRRWEKRFSRYFHAGISETAKTSKTPNPLAFILPSYYLYQLIYLDDVDKEFNVLVAIDATYKFSPRFEGYIDYLIDDRTAPQFLLDEPAWNIPRKTGYLIGAYSPDLLGDGTTGLRLEYIMTEPGTYGATRPDFPGLAYTHDGFIIGHPVGQNSEAFFVRLDRKFGREWTAFVELLDRKPRNPEGVNPDDTRRFSIFVARDVAPRASLILRYDSLRLPEKEDRLQFGASYAF